MVILTLMEKILFYLIAILDSNPRRRLGRKGAIEVKSHPYFHDIEWQELFNKNFNTPISPHDGFEI